MSSIPFYCECCDEAVPTIRLTATDLQGTVLDTEYRCQFCAESWEPALPHNK